MRIYIPKPLRLLRITIRKKGCENQYLTIKDAEPDFFAKYVKEILVNKIDPYGTGPKTAVDIREAEGAKNKKSISVSFYGLEPKEVHDIICGNLNKQDGNT